MDYFSFFFRSETAGEDKWCSVGRLRVSSAHADQKVGCYCTVFQLVRQSQGMLSYSFLLFIVMLLCVIIWCFGTTQSCSTKLLVLLRM